MKRVSIHSAVYLVPLLIITLYLFAGVTMKLMDEVAGIVAVRHCKTNVVTASVDAINFHRKIKKGKQEERQERHNRHNSKGVDLILCLALLETIQSSNTRGLTHVIFYTET